MYTSLSPTNATLHLSIYRLRGINTYPPFRHKRHYISIVVLSHTQLLIPPDRHDVATHIPDGSIQRAGENVLSLVKELASSPFLDDPGSDKHGKVIFFDVLGLFSVVYPERIAIIVNCLVVLFSMASLYFGIAHKKHQSGM